MRQVLPSNISKDSAIKQFEILAKMDISTRAEITFQLSNNLRSILESGIRYRHPNYTREQITQAVLKITLERELFEKIFPGCEVSA